MPKRQTPKHQDRMNRLIMAGCHDEALNQRLDQIYAEWGLGERNAQRKPDARTRKQKSSRNQVG